jgi:PilZ domain
VSKPKAQPDPRTRRRSKRPLIRIPIEVRGTDVNGRSFSEATHTMTVNRNGARISLKNALVPGERITITNLQREESCAFRVVERTSTTYGHQAEWGVECLDRNRNFWGIYFPEVTASAAQAEGVDVMLECSGCRARELAQISTEQYRELTESSKLMRDCPQCGNRTSWEFGFAEVLLEEARAKAPADVAEALRHGADRRQTKRFVAMLPLKIRGLSGQAEIARTENLSKLGLCFISDIRMEVEDAIYLSVGPTENGKKEIPGRVAWKRPVAGSDRSIYGVRVEAKETAT